jgi:hypothetical protein
MMQLAVQIVRFVDDEPQPGIVACEFVDANGHRHTLIDKVPMCSGERVDANSAYPQPGGVRCEALARWRDANGRDVVRITTDLPDHVESSEGVSEFVVLSGQLSSVATESGQ